MSKDERSKFPRFRELLNEALLIKRTEQPSNLLTSVKAAMAENLGYAIHTIERWRQGYLPGQEQAIEDLVRYFVPPMDRNWAEAILVQAQTKYPPDKARALIEELFPSVGSMHSSWRGEPAEDKTVLNRVITKIDYLRSNTDRPYTLLGSVYLDQIIISPISILELEKQEDQEITIYPFKYDLGGSTLWVGRILYLLSQRSSFLFSVQGRDEGDTFTREFKIRLSKETLLEGRTEQAKVENEPKSHRWLFDYVREIGRNDSRTAATLHLLTANHRFTTMLTHTGVLNDFDWGVVKDQLYRILKEGGTLYLAGYFKTNLSKELFEHLNQLAQLNTLVCLDHGRLVYGFINQGAVKDLLNAFASNAVDIYFCTLNELWRLYHFNFQEPVPEHSNNQQIMNILNELKGFKLPPITVVRDSNFRGSIKAYLIIDSVIYPIRGKEAERINECIGPNSAFNAGFIHYLTDNMLSSHKLKDNKVENLIELAKGAAHYALEAWHHVARDNPFQPY